jgi:hypothetical protein
MDRLLVRGAAPSVLAVLVDLCSMLGENGETEMLEPLLRRHGSYTAAIRAMRPAGGAAR